MNGRYVGLNGYSILGQIPWTRPSPWPRVVRCWGPVGPWKDARCARSCGRSETRALSRGGCAQILDAIHQGRLRSLSEGDHYSATSSIRAASVVLGLHERGGPARVLERKVPCWPPNSRAPPAWTLQPISTSFERLSWSTSSARASLGADPPQPLNEVRTARPAGCAVRTTRCPTKTWLEHRQNTDETVSWREDAAPMPRPRDHLGPCRIRLRWRRRDAHWRPACGSRRSARWSPCCGPLDVERALDTAADVAPRTSPDQLAIRGCLPHWCRCFLSPLPGSKAALVRRRCLGRTDVDRACTDTVL